MECNIFLIYLHTKKDSGNANKSESKRFSRADFRQSASEDGFWLLVSSNPHMRFRLVASRDLATLGISSSGGIFWPFSVSHLPGFGQSR